MTRAIITADQLVAAGAYCEELDRFREKFGDQTIVTVKKAVKVALLFNWWWVERLLDEEGKVEFDRACKAAWEERRNRHAKVWAERRAGAMTRREHKCAYAAAHTDYRRAVAAAWAAAYIATVERRKA